ncbi:MAG: DUF3995 domain-containing protein [Bacteroidia bacterium]
MTTIIAIIEISIFLLLSGIHFYWVFGGKWGTDAVFPTTDDTIKVAMPGIIPTLTVTLGLLFFGFIVLANAVNLGIEFPKWIHFLLNYGLWVIAGIFIVRAIGEFNYVGFFKKIKHTKFAVNDTKYYSPLCFIIGILALILELNK